MTEFEKFVEEKRGQLKIDAARESARKSIGALPTLTTDQALGCPHCSEVGIYRVILTPITEHPPDSELFSFSYQALDTCMTCPECFKYWMFNYFPKVGDASVTRLFMEWETRPTQ